MAALLQGNHVESINCTSSGAPSSARSDTSPGSHASIPSDCSTPTKNLLQDIAAGHQSQSEESPPRPATPPSPRQSPPGFPPSPRHHALLSPLRANKKNLGEMFNDADLEPHDHAQLSVLVHTDPRGQVTYDCNGVTTFLTSVDVTCLDTEEINASKAIASMARVCPTTVYLPVTASSSVASTAGEPFVPVFTSSDDC